jgi:general stress protein YciG
MDSNPNLQSEAPRKLEGTTMLDRENRGSDQLGGDEGGQLNISENQNQEQGQEQAPRQTKGRGRGFASMDPAKQREIASKGGKAAHQKGTAHEFTSEEAREAGRKGGQARGKRTH